MADSDFILGGLFQRHMEHLTAAFAVTRGADHILIYANAAFLKLSEATEETALGRPITHAFVGRRTDQLTEVLDRVFRTGIVQLDHDIELANEGSPPWCCSVWPSRAPR